MSDLKLATTDYVDEHSNPGYERIKEDANSVYIEGPTMIHGPLYLDDNGGPSEIRGFAYKSNEKYDYWLQPTDTMVIASGEGSYTTIGGGDEVYSESWTSTLKLSNDKIELKRCTGNFDYGKNILKAVSNKVTLGEDSVSVFIDGPLFAGNSVFVAGPIHAGAYYDSNGNQLGNGSVWIEDTNDFPNRILELGKGTAGYVNSIFVSGPMYINKEINFHASNAKLSAPDQINIIVGSTMLELTESKLEKFKTWLEG